MSLQGPVNAGVTSAITLGTYTTAQRNAGVSTATGTAGTINGEANLTFNGTNLGVNGAAAQTPIDVISNSSGNGITVRGRSADGLGNIRLMSNNYATLYGGITHNATNLTIFNEQSGSLILGTNGTDRLLINSSGHVLPNSNNTYDLGQDAQRWRNVYTNDLNLSNEGSTNDVDGTWGNYTIQEGEEDLFLINRRTGKKYKFMLQEVE